MAHRQGKGYLIIYNTLCGHVLTQKHWQVPFPRTRHRQSFIHLRHSSTRKNPFSDTLSRLGPSVHGVAYIKDVRSPSG